jgi:sugar/nucleoside kinase (ribokinase family)
MLIREQEAAMPEIWTMGELLVEIMRPKAGMPLGEPGQFLGPFPSGAPAIFIDTVARLGHSAGIIGGVAEDDFGSLLVDRLRSDGVDVRYVEMIPGRATAVAFVTYFEDGSRKFIYHIDGTPAVMTHFPECATDGKPFFFHVMGCSLMTNDRFREEIFKAAEAFRAAGARISFDPNLRAELLGDRDLMDVVGPILKYSAILLPGETELKLIAQQQERDNSVARLFQNEDLQIIVLKRGKQGATIYSRDRIIETPAYQVEEVDPTGAGDCFDAGFLCGLLEGKDLDECGRMAAAAGALNAAAFGPMEGDISPARLARVRSAGDRYLHKRWPSGCNARPARGRR